MFFAWHFLVSATLVLAKFIRRFKHLTFSRSTEGSDAELSGLITIFISLMNTVTLKRNHQLEFLGIQMLARERTYAKIH